MSLERQLLLWGLALFALLALLYSLSSILTPSSPAPCSAICSTRSRIA